MRHRHIVFAILTLLTYSGISQTVQDINKPTIAGLDEIAPFSEGLAAVRKGNQWGFIDKTGKLTIDFKDDIVWHPNSDSTNWGIERVGYPQFKEGYCFIQKLDDEGIPHYGFMDNTGKIVIEPEFLNLTQFDNGYAIGIYVRKDFRGKNEFNLNIYDYSLTEVIINTSGEMVWPIQERKNILMSKRLYKMPKLHSKILTKDLLGVKGSDGQWKVVKITLNKSGSK